MHLFKFLFWCAPLFLRAQDTLALDKLVAEALESNPEILAAQKRVEAARQRPSQKRTLPDPMVSPSYSSNGAPWPGAGLGVEPTSNIGFMVSQEFPGPGTRRLRGDIAVKEADAEFQQYEVVRLSMISRLKQAFHRLHHAYAELEVLSRARELQTRFLRIAEARYSTGKGMQADLFRAQTQLTLIETRALKMEQDRAMAQAELNSLLNRRPGSPLGVPETLPLRPLTIPVEEVAARAAASPAILRQQSMVQRGELGVNLARKEFRPGYTVAAGYFHMGRMPDMFQMRVDIPLPIHLGQKQTAALHEQVHRLSEARRNYEAARQDLEFRVRETYARAETGFRLLKLYEDTLIPQGRFTAESSLSAYEAGTGDFLAVLGNLSSIVDYEERYHEEMLAYLNAITRLEELTGADILK